MPQLLDCSLWESFVSKIIAIFTRAARVLKRINTSFGILNSFTYHLSYTRSIWESSARLCCFLLIIYAASGPCKKTLSFRFLKLSQSDLPLEKLGEKDRGNPMVSCNGPLSSFCTCFVPLSMTPLWHLGNKF